MYFIEVSLKSDLMCDDFLINRCVADNLLYQDALIEIAPVSPRRPILRFGL
jgi:hypothetical protein